MKGKYISIGIGDSSESDSYRAAMQAARDSMDEIGKAPTFSIVYTKAEADQHKIAEGINKIIGTNWVGLSTDKQFNSSSKYRKDTAVSVVSLYSKYLHIGIGVAQDYRKNPRRAAVKATLDAMRSVKRERTMDAYIQFTRTQKQTYENIVKTPPYFILSFASIF